MYLETGRRNTIVGKCLRFLMPDQEKKVKNLHGDLSVYTHHCFCYRLSYNLSTEISGTSWSSLSVVMLKIVGEPIEKLSLWGQSACALNIQGKKQVIVFGGFGGLGRHARSNYSLSLDPQSGLLREIEVASSPPPRMGHTSSLVGSSIFVIGGRAGPLEILNDVWVLETTENQWSLLDCSGHVFNPR
ncbi:hypothetical protein GW17_00026857 [Ensete ventricosum]|nr:hypothetical protein GW17_00026857 [Ensete ventricosum]